MRTCSVYSGLCLLEYTKLFPELNKKEIEKIKTYYSTERLYNIFIIYSDFSV